MAACGSCPRPATAPGSRRRSAAACASPAAAPVDKAQAGLLGATALGAAAATTQDLVLPRMRGTATAAFFLGTTLVGLSFGPYMVGQISDLAGTMVDGKLVGNLRVGILSLIAVAPIALGLLIAAYRAVPKAEQSIVERARAAGEPV